MKFKGAAVAVTFSGYLFTLITEPYSFFTVFIVDQEVRVFSSFVGVTDFTRFLIHRSPLRKAVILMGCCARWHAVAACLAIACYVRLAPHELPCVIVRVVRFSVIPCLWMNLVIDLPISF